MVVPTVSYSDGDFDRPESQQQQQDRSTALGYSFLLMSLWIFMPLLSWKRTSTLYNEAVLHVTSADPVNFEVSFRNGMSRLSQWYWEQMALRYLFLSMYSALVLWDSNHLK